MIFIACNYESKVISIVNARSLELANAYWQGKGIVPHTVQNLKDDFIPLDKHITGVYPILETEKKKIYISGSFKEFLCVK